MSTPTLTPPPLPLGADIKFTSTQRAVLTDTAHDSACTYITSHILTTCFTSASPEVAQTRLGDHCTMTVHPAAGERLQVAQLREAFRHCFNSYQSVYLLGHHIATTVAFKEAFRFDRSIVRVCFRPGQPPLRSSASVASAGDKRKVASAIDEPTSHKRFKRADSSSVAATTAAAAAAVVAVETETKATPPSPPTQAETSSSSSSELTRLIADLQTLLQTAGKSAERSLNARVYTMNPNPGAWRNSNGEGLECLEDMTATERAIAFTGYASFNSDLLFAIDDLVAKRVATWIAAGSGAVASDRPPYSVHVLFDAGTLLVRLAFAPDH